MNTINPKTTLGSLVLTRPNLAPLLELRGLDYCCGGHQSLEDACQEAGLDTEEILDALAEVPLPANPPPWIDLGLVDLTDHIEAIHHAYLRDELPRLNDLLDKVTGTHSERHPELFEIQRTLTTLRNELEPHLLKEEAVLFPIIRELATATSKPQFHCGTVCNPVSAMAFEHDRAGEILSRLHTLTDGYAVPADGCASYALLYQGLARVEADTHQHIHKENNVLFPAAIRAELALTERAP